MKQRFAMYMGHDDLLVGDPRQAQTETTARYACQRLVKEHIGKHNIPRKDRYEPVPRVMPHHPMLEKAVKNGELDRSPFVVASTATEALELLSKTKLTGWAHDAVKAAIAATKPDPVIEARLKAEAKAKAPVKPTRKDEE